MTKRMPGRLVPHMSTFRLLLFISGASALIYEVLWTRMLLSVFGATVYASGTVLTSFMAGLGSGGYLAARFGHRTRLHPLILYGLLELGIGIFALVFPLILKGITAAYVSAYGTLDGQFTPLLAVRFLLAFLALLVPTTLMGATLPIITRFGVTGIDSLGRDLGRLYGINTIGAALGTLVTGFLLIEFLGIRAATFVAVALNLTIFLAALALGGGRWRVAAPTAGPALGDTPAGAPAGAPAVPGRRIVTATLLVSGLCALGYEVLWSRIMVYVLGNFVQSFCVMLSAFLTGIALGGWWLGRRVDTMANPWRTFAILQLVIGLAAIAILPLFQQVIVWREAFLGSLSGPIALAEYRDPWLKFTLWKVSITFAMMIVPTFCMGACFPLANRLYTTSFAGVSRGVGELYAVNTLGGILGAFLTSFLLIPAIGVRNASLLLAALNLLAGAMLFAHRAGALDRRRLRLAFAGAACLVAVGLLAVPRTVFHTVYASAETDKKLMYVDETASGTVTIHEASSGLRVIDINGLNVAGTKFGFLCTQKLQAHFPLLMHENPRNILQIGFGTGCTCHSVARHPEVERIDCCEINPGVIEAAPFFTAANREVLADPRVTVFIEDARNFVMTTKTRYDVILSDSIHPRFTGNGLLYTREYYRQCAAVMNPDGVHSTWMPTAFLGTREFKAIIRTMQAVFPHVLIWYMNNTIEGYAIVMGKLEPFEVDFDRLVNRMQRPALRIDLAEVHVASAYDLLDFILIAGPDVARYLGDGPLNTEDRPIIEFGAPRNMNRTVTEYLNLQEMLRFRSFDERIVNIWSTDPVVAESRRQAMLRYFQATRAVLNAHQAHLVGQYALEQGLLEEAGRINPDDRDAPFLLARLQTLRSGGPLD